MATPIRGRARRKSNLSFPQSLAAKPEATAHFVELRGQEKAGLLVEGSTCQTAAEEDVVAVINGQAVLHGGLLAQANTAGTVGDTARAGW